jgi:hypothetical protein
MELSLNDSEREKPKYSEEKVTHCHFFLKKDPTYFGLGRTQASHIVYLIVKLHFEGTSEVIFVDGLHLSLQMKL